MIDPTRQELLTLLEELSRACPEYRFGQMVLNLAFLACEDGDRQTWDLEDAEFIKAARKHLADWYATHGKSEDAASSLPALAPTYMKTWRLPKRDPEIVGPVADNRIGDRIDRERDRQRQPNQPRINADDLAVEQQQEKIEAGILYPEGG